MRIEEGGDISLINMELFISAIWWYCATYQEQRALLKNDKKWKSDLCQICNALQKSYPQKGPK